MKRAPVLFLLALVFSGLALGVLWGWKIPLGVPGEWTWGRIPIQGTDAWDVALCGLGCALAGALYAGLVRAGATRIDEAGFLESSFWLATLTAAAFGWLIILELSPPAGFGLSKSAWVLYYPGPSGYFHEARYRKETTGEYLANYEKDIQSQDVKRRVLHHGTHPPGLFLCYRGLIHLCESSPGLVRVLLQTEPPSVSGMFDEIASQNRRTGRILKDSDRAVIWLMTLITHLLGAAVVAPLFFLARHIASKPAAWTAAAFWPLLPALAVFLPKSDVLYAFFGTLFLAVWLSGWSRRCFLRCFLAGGIFGGGMLFSLALLPVGLLAALITIWEVVFASDRDTKRSRAKSAGRLVLAAGLGFLVPTLAMGLVWGLNLPAVWWLNYQNHAEFYQHFPRSYGTWLAVNPLETFFALGAPAAVLFLAAWVRLWKDRNSLPRETWGAYAGFAAVMGLLWITGKNRGEAARLWLVVFPYFLWLSARIWEPDPSPPPHNRPAASPLPFLALQLIVCWFTVVRVNGFPLPL